MTSDNADEALNLHGELLRSGLRNIAHNYEMWHWGSSWNWRLGELRSVLQEMETTISNRENRLLEKANRFWDSRDAKTHGDFFNYELVFAADAFYRIARQALFLTFFGIFEHQIRLLCKAQSRVFKSHQLADESDRLEHYKKFLIREAKVPPKAFGRDWNLIMQMKPLRNTFAHYGGVINDHPKKNAKQRRAVQRFVKAHQEFFITGEGGEILIQPGCNEWLLELMNSSIVAILRHQNDASLRAFHEAAAKLPKLD